MGIKKTYKKLLSALVIIVFAVIAVAGYGAGHAQAASIKGFTTAQLSSINPKGSAFFFTSKKTIGMTIAGKTAYFNATQTPTDLGTVYTFMQDGSFCRPSDAVIYQNQAHQPVYPDQSLIFVKFSDFNGPTGQLVSGNGSGDSQLWPGANDSVGAGGKSNCGKQQGTLSNGDPAYVPIFVSQDKIGPQAGLYTGTGSRYTSAVVKSAKYKLVNAGLIQMTFTAADPSHGVKSVPGPIKLVDADPYDGTHQYVSQSVFCSSDGNGRALKFTLAPRGGFADSSIPANFSGSGDQLGFVDPSTGKCQTDTSKWPASIAVANPSNSLTDKSSARFAQEFAQWNPDGSSSIVLLSCDTGSQSCSATGQTLSTLPNGNASTYVENSSGCNGWTIVLNSGSSYQGTISHRNGTNCTNNSNDPSRAVAILGTKGTPEKPPTDNPGAAASLDCQTASATHTVPGYTLAFVICPMLDAAQSFSDWLIGQVENLLSFTFQHNLGDKSQQGNVQNAWGHIRDLASVFLVIIMLVMVLSQAISWGPFDAYTIRKVMPRLVIAVVLMQVSWSLLDYVTRLFDDFGHGIADLMYAPFGGPAKLQLGAILQAAGIPAYAGGSVVLAALLGIGVIAVLSLPTILLVGWSIVLALLVAFVTLSVRQILIITMIILSPLAILLWILPNTQRYWKLWYDNFTKLLLMFPMIIGMIAAGRIFADITSSGNNNKLIKFMMILIGYFGPFFLIPKTYKWGGAAMAAASGAIANAAPKLGGPVTNYLKGTQERSRWHLARESRKAELNRRAKAGFAEGLTSGNVVRRGINRSRLLGLNPHEGEINRRIVASARSAREEELKKRGDEAAQPLAAEGNWGGLVEMAQHGSEHEQDAAIEQLVKARRWDDIGHNNLQHSPQWGRAVAHRQLFSDINENRADFAPGVIAGGAALPALAGGSAPGISVAQLGTQSEQFFRDVEGTGIAGADLNGYVDRLREVARSPSAQGILGTAKQTHIDASLARWHAAQGGVGPAPRFSDIVQQSRVPATGPAPTTGPQIAPAAGGGFTIGSQPLTAGQQAIHAANDAGVEQIVNTTGGWAAMHPDDVMFIYQTRSDASPLKQRARDELLGRGIISP